MTKEKIVLSYSGGKDSTALLLGLKERGEMPDKIVFADTLMEFPEMYAFIEKVEKYIGQPIIRTEPDNNFFEWFFGKFTRGKLEGQIRGFPYTIGTCWYQREAKVNPMKPYTDSADVVYIGYCYGENRSRKEKKYVYPLKEWKWTEKKCRQVCKEHGLLNPLYEKFDRLGCWMCPKQGRKALKVIQRDYPSHWNIIKQLEKISPNGFGLNDTSNLPRDIFTWIGDSK